MLKALSSRRPAPRSSGRVVTCGCGDVGRPEETWCGRDISDVPMILRWRDRMALLLSDELGIDGDRMRFTATTGCFNRPRKGVVEIVGWSAEERERVRELGPG